MGSAQSILVCISLRTIAFKLGLPVVREPVSWDNLNEVPHTHLTVRRLSVLAPIAFSVAFYSLVIPLQLDIILLSQ